MAVTRLKRKAKRNKRAVFLLKQRIKHFSDVEIKERSIRSQPQHVLDNLAVIAELEKGLKKEAPKS